MISNLMESVRDRLSDHVAGPYRLDDTGQQKVLEANASIGSTYVKEHVGGVSPYWRWFFGKAVASLDLNSTDLVVDVCCGSGRVCLNVMTSGLFARAIGVDISVDQVKALRDAINELGLTSAECIVGSVLVMPFPDDSVDCVMGHSFLHHLPDNPAFLREIHRVLRPGGAFCFTHEPSVSAGRIEQALIRRWTRLFKPRNDGLTQGPMTDIWSYDSDSLSVMLAEAGFSDVSIDARGYLATMVGAFIERAWRKVYSTEPPSLLYVPREILHCVDRVLFSHRHQNDFSSFLLRGWK